jgi:hypothetical protein
MTTHQLSQSALDSIGSDVRIDSATVALVVYNLLYVDVRSADSNMDVHSGTDDQPEPEYLTR